MKVYIVLQSVYIDGLNEPETFIIGVYADEAQANNEAVNRDGELNVETCWYESWSVIGAER